MLAHFQGLFNKYGPLAAKGDHEWNNVQETSFFRILLCAGCCLSSVSDMYDQKLWTPDCMEFDYRNLPRKRMSQLMSILNNIADDELTNLEKVFAEVMVPFVPTKSYAAAYDDEQQRKGNRQKMKQAVNESRDTCYAHLFTQTSVGTTSGHVVNDTPQPVIFP